MQFDSYIYALFLPIVFILYWALRKHLKWQNFMLLVASYIFYGWWDWRFLGLIALTSASTFLTGLAIKPGHSKQSKTWVALNIFFNIGILATFKYFNFFRDSLADVLRLIGVNPDMPTLYIILPVGISFYTLQAISYTLDLYRGKVEHTRDIVAFFVYIAFFPQLVAGPIERAGNLLPQFLKEKHFDYHNAVIGMRQILWGLVKKIVIADNLAGYVDNIFYNPLQVAPTSLIMATLIFAIQIYADFSGYSDIAIGCAKLFGIRLRRNFNVPYFSRDIAEFWRRWHISLTTWFRDYIYIPLGGSRVPKGRIVVNTFIIFLLSGLWHGANWTFIAWGAFHALLFLPLILTGKNRKHLEVVANHHALPSPLELLQMLATFLLTVMGWILFRADSISDAFHYFAHMFSSLFDGSPNITSPIDAWVLSVSILVMTVVEWINRDQEHEFRLQPRVRPLRWAFYVVLLFSIGAYMVTNEMPFIYFQF